MHLAVTAFGWGFRYQLVVPAEAFASDAKALVAIAADALFAQMPEHCLALALRITGQPKGYRAYRVALRTSVEIEEYPGRIINIQTGDVLPDFDRPVYRASPRFPSSPDWQWKQFSLRALEQSFKVSRIRSYRRKFSQTGSASDTRRFHETKTAVHAALGFLCKD